MNLNAKFSSDENKFENVIFNMTTIIVRPPCVQETIDQCVQLDATIPILDFKSLHVELLEETSKYCIFYHIFWVDKDNFWSLKLNHLLSIVNNGLQ